MNPPRSHSIPRRTDLLDGRPLGEGEVIVDLGWLPIPGLFLPTAELAAGVSSQVRLVRGPSGLLQLDRDLDPRLYYHYKSGRVDQAHLDHVERTAAEIARSLPVDASILEIGGGAGHLMRALLKHGFHRLHVVDPSAENQEARGYQVINGLFPDALRGASPRFDLIIGQHYLEHSPQPVAILGAARELLTDRGQIWIEVPDIERSALSDHGAELSIIYALHSAYYDRTTLAQAGRAAGLAVRHVTPVDHYGRSIVAVFAKSGDAAGEREPSAATGPAVTAAVRAYFSQLTEFGRTLPAGLPCWGAAERCLAVLGACMAGGFRPGMICDSNPDLRGLYLPGLGQPVRSPDEVPDPIQAVLMLSWRHAAAIVRANRARFSPDAAVYIPFAGRREIAQFFS